MQRRASGTRDLRLLSHDLEPSVPVLELPAAFTDEHRITALISLVMPASSPKRSATGGGVSTFSDLPTQVLGLLAGLCEAQR
jgi:hypothetical protein